MSLFMDFRWSWSKWLLWMSFHIFPCCSSHHFPTQWPFKPLGLRHTLLPRFFGWEGKDLWHPTALPGMLLDAAAARTHLDELCTEVWWPSSLVILQPRGCVLFCMYVRWCMCVGVCAVWLLCEVKVIMLSLQTQSNHNLDGAYSSS